MKRPHYESNSDQIHCTAIERTPSNKIITFYYWKNHLLYNYLHFNQKTKKWNHPHRSGNKKASWDITKTEKFHNINTYPHERLNLSWGVVRNKDLSLCSITKIKNELKNSAIDIKRITIRKLSQTTDTNTCILTFNNPKSPPEIKIGYTQAEVKKYIPNPRRCHNCQKYGHLKETCSRKPVCVKYGAHKPDHTEDTCTNNLNCNNCYESHRADSKLKKWKKESEREILKIKVTQNISFLEARSFVEMSLITPAFVEITKIPPNENHVNTQIKTKNQNW